MIFTDEEKIVAMKERGWESIKGYCFNVPAANEEWEQTFVEECDAAPVIAKGPQLYFTHDRSDGAVYELEQAWESFLDDWYDEFDNEYPSKGGGSS